MTNEHVPVPVGEPEWERGLWTMVLASGVLHIFAIALVLIIPHTFLHRPPAMKSYTVDLIAPDHVGGTNMIAGGKGRVEGQPMAAAPKVEAPKPPPPPKVEQPKPPEPKAEEPKVEPPKPEPPKPEPQKVEPPKPPPPEEAKPAPKPQPPKQNEAVLAEKAKPAPPPPPKAAPAQPQPPKAVAKAEPPKPSKAEAKAAAEAAKAAKEAAATKARDDQIQAAIRRVEQQEGKRGAGTGTKAGEQPGGPISVGPGEGAGGTVKGVEYLLYYNQMINRIKQVWAWAGASHTLEATVRFNITENGEVVNVRISKPSGDPSYDASVERAVRAANPLPPPPEGYRKEFSDVELIFRPEDLAG